jgi:putative transposase
VRVCLFGAQAFRSHCGAQRFAFNFGLALVRANLDQRAAERSYGLAEADLTPAVSWSAYGLRRAWNAAKHDVAPWWAENSKEAYSSGLANLAAALSNWSSSRSGKRAGRKIAFPRFKGRRSRSSCRFTAGAFGLAADRRHVRLPRIGLVRTCESTRKLARKIETGRAPIRSVILSWQRGRWHVSFSVELPDPESPDRGPARTGGRVVGIDLGISALATLSTGERVPNGRRLDRELRRLRRAQRRVSRRGGPADRWFASSKICSGCGAAKAKLGLSERRYACATCGLVPDRDHNAARNLAALAADTGELRREQPDRTGVRPARPAAVAVGPLREESRGTQRHHREAVAR